jgi:adenosylcobinamide-GDP ribazoletransferase
MVDAVRLAVGTLSVLPAAMPRKVDRVIAGRAMVLAPVVGLVLGGLAAAVLAGTEALRPDAPLLAAVLGVLALIALSGALHLDGLADTADGLGSRRDRETILRIMKQGDVGPFGVAAIIGVLLTDVAALTACVQAGIGWQALLIAGTASRLALPWCCRTGVPSARPEGLGAMVAATVRPIAAALATLVAVAFAVVLLGLSHAEHQPALSVVIGAAVAVLVPVGIGLTLVRRAREVVGGITGDVLGAAVELGLAAALLTLALAA